jgi:hypothetical protein
VQTSANLLRKEIPMEEIYIGTKIVAGEEMDEETFFLTIRPGPGNVWIGDSRPGFKVRYEDGYISWSPKGTFERAYRKVTVQEAEMVSNGQFVIPDSSGSTMKVA